MLLAGLLGVSATGAARAAAHSLTLSVNLAVLSNIAHHVLYKCRARAHPSHLGRFGPFYLTALACLLCNLDPLRHVLLDSGYGGPALAMYRPHCRSPSTWACLSATGWLVTIVATYAGLACLLAGVLWSAGVVGKVRALWRRGQRARPTPDGGAPGASPA